MKQISLFIIITCFAGCYGAEPHETGKEGKQLPAFSLLLTDSTTWLKTTQLSKGKPMVLFYFSPFCPYCKAQTEEIIEDMDKLKDIQFIFVSKFPMPDIKTYQKKYHLTKYPNIITALDTSSFVSDYFEIPGVPYLAIYNKNKKLSKTYLGKTYSSQIKKASEE